MGCCKPMILPLGEVVPGGEKRRGGRDSAQMKKKEVLAGCVKKADPLGYVRNRGGHPLREWKLHMGRNEYFLLWVAYSIATKTIQYERHGEGGLRGHQKRYHKK